MLFDNVDRKGTNCSKWDGILGKFGRDDILPLWVADSDLAIPSCIQEAVSTRASHPIYGYALYSDLFYDSIVSWYSKRFDWSISKDWIIGEHGVVVAINLAIKAFSDEDDGILIQTPIYPPFISSVRQNHRKILENRLIFKDGKTSIDFEDFEEKAKQAKIFLLCSPHNPSTRAWTSEELTRMANICHENNVIVVSDEIHSDLIFSSKHTPFASINSARENTIILHAPSKTFNIAGLNTSYTIIPNKDLRQIYVSEHQKAGLSNGNVFGVSALVSAYRDGEEWLEELLGYISNNSLYIQKYISDNIPEIKVYEHNATFLMWLDCSGLGFDDDALSDFFINNAKLGLNAGVSFGLAGSGFMRLNIGTSIQILEQAMQQLDDAVKSLSNKCL